MASVIKFIFFSLSLFFTILLVGCERDLSQNSSELAAQVDVLRLQQDVAWLADDARLGRKAGTAAEDEVGQWLVKRFMHLGLSPFSQLGLDDYQQSFPIIYRKQSNYSADIAENIIGVLEGAAKPTEYIVISAHYDHLGVVNNAIFNGADDNATGVAALLELARIFSSSNLPPSKSIIFIAFSAEELGRQGSKKFCNSLIERSLSNAMTNLNLEMLGGMHDAAPYLNVWDNGEVSVLIDALDHASNVLNFGLLVSQGGGPPSDGQQLASCGLRATTIDLSGGADFKLNHPHYHKQTDLPQHIDYQSFALAVQVLAYAVWQLAN